MAIGLATAVLNGALLVGAATSHPREVMNCAGEARRGARGPPARVAARRLEVLDLLTATGSARIAGACGQTTVGENSTHRHVTHGDAWHAAPSPCAWRESRGMLAGRARLERVRAAAGVSDVTHG